MTVQYADRFDDSLISELLDEDFVKDIDSDDMPLILSKNVILFPGGIVPFFFEVNSNQISGIECAMQGNKLIFLSYQESEDLNIREEVLSKFGLICKIRDVAIENGTITSVLLMGLKRGDVNSIYNKQISDSDANDTKGAHHDTLSDNQSDGSLSNDHIVDNITQDNLNNLQHVIYVDVSIVNTDILDDEKSEITSVFASILNFLRQFQQLNDNFFVRNSIAFILRKADENLSMQLIECLADIISFRMRTDILDKFILLQEKGLLNRLKRIQDIFRDKMLSIEAQKKIDQKVEQNIRDAQANYVLHEQLKAIQEQLGINNNEFSEFENKIAGIGLSEEARAIAQSELSRLKQMNPTSSEATVVRIYLETLLSLPWGKCSSDNNDINLAKNILDEDHYGLDEIKDRILEHICVQIRLKMPNSSVLCFVGPPGVGKTSLCKSIAKALDRKFVSVALGGVGEEPFIRGHRKTYVGAVSGKIIKSLATAGTDNPVILLDEIDKLDKIARAGDPASALLEVLDRSQNSRFEDHYIGVPYDLSKVMFLCTANSFDIKKPLLDRMEVITLSSYTREEKFHIAKNYLIKDSLKRNGIVEGEIKFVDEVIYIIIDLYTREAGVRELSRKIDKICRKFLLISEIASPKKDRNCLSMNDEYNGMRSVVNKEVCVDESSDNFYHDSELILKNLNKNSYKDDLDFIDEMVNKDKTINHTQDEPKIVEIINPDNIATFLGDPIYNPEDDVSDNLVGVVNGLAWTEVGGEILRIEVVTIKGTGKIQITGNVGKVMEESLKAAVTFVFANADNFEIVLKQNEVDIHVHMPEAATPKDGPSAGIAIVTALVSSLTNRPINANFGMTGEITLHGLVLPIGGLKEKIIAALRAGIKNVIIPQRNERDLKKIEKTYKSALKDVNFIKVNRVNEVINIALI